MKKLLFALFLVPAVSQAQNFHFSGRFGLAGYQGDLKDGQYLSQDHIMGSIGALYDLSEHIAARTYFSLTKLQGDDKKGSSAMQLRNLNFQSKLFEWELSAQYSFFSLNDKWWTPYVFAGAGLYHFNPYTSDAGGNKVYLAPLSTEGQGFINGKSNYKLTQFNIPLGIGATYSLGEDVRLGLELGYRKLFTDYLDDVSTNYVDQAALLAARGPQAVDLAWRGDEVNGAPYPAGGLTRGGADHKDGYYYAALTLTVRYWFDKYKQIAGIPSGGKSKKVGCPASRAATGF